MILATSAFHQNNFGIAMSPDPFPCERSGKGRQRQTSARVGLRLRYTLLMIFMTKFSDFIFEESKQV